MSRFTPQEIDYLKSQRLCRMATIDAKGDLHVVPVGFRYNPEEETIDIGGHNQKHHQQKGSENDWRVSTR